MELLADFIKAVLNIPDDDLVNLTIKDPHLIPRSAEERLGILDVMVETQSSFIDVEIQLNSTRHFKKRIAYYNAKMYAQQAAEGYNLRRAISIRVNELRRSRLSSIRSAPCGCDLEQSSFTLKTTLSRLCDSTI